MSLLAVGSSDALGVSATVSEKRGTLLATLVVVPSELGFGSVDAAAVETEDGADWDGRNADDKTHKMTKGVINGTMIGERTMMAIVINPLTTSPTGFGPTGVSVVSDAEETAAGEGFRKVLNSETADN